MITKRELKRQVAALEMLDGRYKDLFRMVLFLARETGVLDEGLCERIMGSLGEE